ncbi:MAG: hypothetical protein ACT6FC_05035 [Methanosarcinaceae archaeon]
MASGLRYRDIYISNEDAAYYPGHIPEDPLDGLASFVCNIGPTIYNPVAISMISATIPQMQTTIDIVRHGAIDVTLAGGAGMFSCTIPKGSYKDILALRDAINENMSGPSMLCYVDALQERMFFAHPGALLVEKIQYWGDIGDIIGFPTTHKGGGMYDVVTPNILLNGIVWPAALIAPYSYDHFGGMHNIYIELTTPTVSSDSLAVSSDQFLKGMAIIKKLNVNYSQDVLNYNASSKEDEIVLALPESAVPLQSIGLAIWGYSGTVHKWFNMKYPGARLEFTLRLYFV